MTDRSATDLANMALDLLGQDDIEDIEQPTNDVERKISRNINDAIDYSLKQARWNACRVVGSVAALDEPEEVYAYIAQLPGDCLTVWSIGGDTKGWEIRAGAGAGRVAHAAGNPAQIVYGRRITPAEMPVELALYCAAELAILCMRGPTVDLSAAKQEAIKRDRDERLMIAADLHAMQGGLTEAVPSRYIAALEGGSDFDALSRAVTRRAFPAADL